MVKACFCAPNPTPVKYMLSTLGFNTKHCRLPLVPVNQDEIRIIEKAMNNLLA
jgi:4-hydroxy-tetrahydrodipicolinate synthase